MPIDLEMILSASPPIFNTAAFMDIHYSHYSRRNHREAPHGNLDKLTLHEFGYGHNGDVRSCLVDRSDDDHQKSEKKRVWFADDKGLALTRVKIMSEPSNCPPRWSDSFLEQITKGIRVNPTPEIQWETLFAQPASDYMAFRNRLQKMCVSLENVILREGDTFSGTIKVKNLAFDKEVFVRVTFDRWHSSQDIPAAFVPSGVDGGPSQNDTFSFSVQIPPSAVKFEVVEFCVCFKCNGKEYWDNNDGQNYKLAILGKKEKQYDDRQFRQFNDALKANLDSWSEFSSWSHLITEGPYW